MTKSAITQEIHSEQPATWALVSKYVIKRDNYTCAYCHGKFKPSEMNADHIYPKSKGGGDLVINLIAACVRCNRDKSDKILPAEHLERLHSIAKERSGIAPSRSGVLGLKIVVRGKEYKSHSAAARDLGVTREIIKYAIRTDQVNLIGTEDFKYKKRSPYGAPVVYNGVSYKSYKDASEKTGVSYSKIWESINNPKEVASPVVIDGNEYRSATDAAKRLGISVSKAKKAVEHGTVNFPRKITKGRPITVNGIEYPSLSSAAKANGVAVSTIKRAEREGALDNFKLRRSRTGLPAGVYWDKERGKYRVAKYVGGKKTWFGRFDDLDSAKMHLGSLDVAEI